MRNLLQLLSASILFLLFSTLCADAKSTLQHPSFSSLSWVIEGDSIINIPDDIREIPPFAFFDNKKIKQIIFTQNSKCKDIGEYAFAGCSSLEKITLPPSISVIREGTFRECETLGEITIPNGVTDIKSFAFIYCYSLKSVTLPLRLQHIGLNAFCRDESLEEIKIPDSVTEIESYAFADCLSLREAKLPANDSLLGELIFNGCKSLVTLYELSPLPPAFDCNSFIFSPLDTEAYGRCRLIVPQESLPLYRKAHGWNLFYLEEAN